MHTDLTEQFKAHDEKDDIRFQKLEQLFSDHVDRCDRILCKLEPIVETVTWLNSTGKFLVWLKPIMIALVSIAGTWLAIKALFK